MAELPTLMYSTLKSLIARDHTQMESLWITGSTHLNFNRAAKFFTKVLVARLVFIANLLAPERADSFHLLRRHECLSFLLRVVNHIAGNLHLISAASAFFVSWHFTPITRSLVTLFLALMFTARQESTTNMITHRNWIRAIFPRVSEQLFNLTVTTWAVYHALRIFLTWLTATFMTNLLAEVLTTV